MPPKKRKIQKKIVFSQEKDSLEKIFEASAEMFPGVDEGDLVIRGSPLESGGNLLIVEHVASAYEKIKKDPEAPIFVPALRTLKQVRHQAEEALVLWKKKKMDRMKLIALRGMPDELMLYYEE